MNDAPPDWQRTIAHRHLMLGWWALVMFAALGIVLETMHAFKMGAYLDPAQRMRRLMWTLAHAHGTLIALVNLAFSAAVSSGGVWSENRLRVASFLMLDGLILVPLGFFLGGIGHTEVDPGIGILFLPIGAILLLFGLILTAITVTRSFRR